MRRAVLIIAATVALAALAPAVAKDWSHYGGGPGGSRFADAAEITPANVDRLTRVWTARTGHMNAPRAALDESKFQATPILAGGKLVLCTPFNTVIALDPATGAEIWRHDPGLVTDGVDPANGFNCRGVTAWTDPAGPSDAPCAARVFMGTNDHRLVALDLATGRPCAGFGENGVVTVDPGMALRWPGEFQITSPPVVAGGAVIVGSAISDNVRVEAPSGAVRAFDVRTGALKWMWDPIERADPARREGHANVWAAMAVDEARGLVFLPTTSPSPDFFGGLRPGDNRHANSVVALEAATGRVRWAFQTVHHDVWDYDLPAQPMLVTIRKDGRPRDVVIQVTKTGLVFVLDRDTGEPVFPVEERAVPQGGVEGETLSPTQPFPVAPAPLSRTTITPEDAFGLFGFDKAACARRIAGARAEGLYTPPTTQGTILFPFTGGGANWGGGAYDPGLNRLYINTSNAMHLITLIPRKDVPEEVAPDRYGEDVEFARMRGAPYAMTREVLRSPIGMPCNPPPWGELHAIDMDTGAEAWRATLGTTEDLAPLGLALKTGTPNLGGPLVTAGGLVFIGAAMDRYLRAFDAKTGAELWRGRLPAGGQATPMSYVWEGRQYVVIAAGGHAELDTPRGDFIVAYAVRRAGDPPAPLTAVLDQPGRRFLALLLGLALALGVLAWAGMRLMRRR
jgi:quinoprotein glucose dehydrogenase